MNYKKYIIALTLCCIAMLLLIISISIFLSLSIAQQEKLELCFAPGCFSFAAKALQEPIKIFKVGVEFGAYAFAAIGATTAIMTYVKTVKTEKINRHFQKATEFKSFVTALVSRNDSGVKYQNFNVNRYYNILFPDSTDAFFTPSDFYKSTINCISEQITETHCTYTPGNKKIIENHFRKIIHLLDTLGISIEEPTEYLLITLEPKIFIFIDSINKQFTNIEIRLQDIARDYSRHV
jgi:hypothetical protein